MAGLTFPQAVAAGYGALLVLAFFAWHYFKTGRLL